MRQKTHGEKNRTVPIDRHHHQQFQPIHAQTTTGVAAEEAITETIISEFGAETDRG